VELRDINVIINDDDVIQSVLDNTSYVGDILKHMDEGEVIEWVTENVNMYHLLSNFDTPEIMEYLLNKHSPNELDYIIAHVPNDAMFNYLVERNYDNIVHKMNNHVSTWDAVLNFLNHIMKQPTQDDRKQFTQAIQRLNPSVKFALLQTLLNFEVRDAI
jgi:hypothetical protein